MNLDLQNKDVLGHIRTMPSTSVHTTFSDPPYFLGTEWYQDANNRWQMKGTGSDFMGAWGVQNADWWREYFKELHRVMKYGGYVVMYSISQQSDMVSSLLREAGFEKCAENENAIMRWATISNFPKASDASKATDRKVGAEREVVGKKDVGQGLKHRAKVNQSSGYRPYVNGLPNQDQIVDVTAPTTELAELLSGYKYGKAPLKKITEPILVFRKAPKNGSVLNDLMACQTDSEISPAVLDIEGNRVGLSEADKEYTIARAGLKNGVNHVMKTNKEKVFNTHLINNIDHNPLSHTTTGRYPCTLFISPDAAELLDSQLDQVSFELNGKIYTKKRLEMVQMLSLAMQNNQLKNFKELNCSRDIIKSHGEAKLQTKRNENTKGFLKELTKNQSGGLETFGDSGYISRVMHQPDFTQHDYDSVISAYNAYSKGINEDTFYFPTVSPKERNAGCQNLLYKGIDTISVLKTNPKSKKQNRSKYSFDSIVENEFLEGKKSKDIEFNFVKLFYELVCEASENEITDVNFVESAININEYDNELAGFTYLGGDIFKVFSESKEFILEIKNVIRNGNGHPTLKPIALNKHILGLFRLPEVFEQTVYIPFSGSGSEVIAAVQLGIKNIISVEINPDFVEIQKARLAYFAKNVKIDLPTQNQQSQTQNIKSANSLF